MCDKERERDGEREREREREIERARERDREREEVKDNLDSVLASRTTKKVNVIDKVGEI